MTTAERDRRRYYKLLRQGNRRARIAKHRASHARSPLNPRRVAAQMRKTPYREMATPTRPRFGDFFPAAVIRFMRHLWAKMFPAARPTTEEPAP